MAPGISQLIARCLQKDLDRRFQSMVELKTALAGACRGIGIPALAHDGDRVAFSWTGGRQDNPDLYVQRSAPAPPSG